ncbi:hypothetical protein FHS04_001292 [Mesoflavibacter sabulilitoris]|uniref:CD-NTase-associated protein 15 domain-containing protein n=1 Tax=Mesoflavibacter zeaxanthinifaciens subsp. sabulilitoris TaxID=1520893 RepID=A0A2T1NAH2_9FLAO|nr:hypothetical protein [Mesoflavibacter zeaxanthinifaciens]MBB3123789.1 hypothetical protein [Mesoflavibacter zeaxanthinifaciens subsp. sabulilitoris]PSG89093.1 hypothetical protein C7H61_09040 [Mesoflavibacter zeaxanthinifaciens subsp. sabulilitoris]
MEKDYLKYYHPQFLIGLAIVGFVLIYLAKESFGLSISVFGALTLLITLITKYLWQYKPFKWLFWIDDFSGRYEGKLVYQYKDNNGNLQTGELEHIKIVSQSGSKINVSSFTKKADGSLSSPSINKGMYVETTQDGQHYNLIYNYHNEGSTEQGFPPHYGTEVIKFINDGNEKKLSGRYFTNRSPYQTKGEFKDLKWVSNNKRHDF